MEQALPEEIDLANNCPTVATRLTSDEAFVIEYLELLVDEICSVPGRIENIRDVLIDISVQRWGNVGTSPLDEGYAPFVIWICTAVESKAIAERTNLDLLSNPLITRNTLRWRGQYQQDGRSSSNGICAKVSVNEFVLGFSQHHLLNFFGEGLPRASGTSPTLEVDALGPGLLSLEATWHLESNNR